LLDPDYQLPLSDHPKYARFKGAENHSISSIDSIFEKKPPLFWQFWTFSMEEKKLAWHHCISQFYWLVPMSRKEGRGEWAAIRTRHKMRES
jgi:hypothetical protein